MPDRSQLAPRDFATLCAEAGFEASFLGGYLFRHELETLSRHRDQAVRDPSLANEHRAFLRDLEFDQAGLPLHRGLHAGVGGAYLLRTTAARSDLPVAAETHVA